MNKEEIEELRLLTLPKKYTYMTNEEFATIKDGFKHLQSQLAQANSKIEKIRECAKNRLKHNEDYIKTESEDANLIYILSIIGNNQ